LAKTFSFNKIEKLKSRKALEHLFSKGEKFLVHPFKVFYSITKNEKSIIHCGVGVSKKNFAKAVQRNRIKRLMREVYRLNKEGLHQSVNQQQIDFFVLYIDKNMPVDINYLNEKMQQVLNNLQQQCKHEMGE
jgi:ribonuclease P protein component